MISETGVINAQQAAEEFGTHVETIRRLARRGEIPSFKVGKDWRFRRKDLLDWALGHHQRNSSFSILVVDDEVSICQVIHSILGKVGYRVITAQTGEEGLEILKRETVHLILLDLMMPGMDGPDFLDVLRKLHDGLPVIVVTGYPEGDLMARALAHGPFMLLAKPIFPHMLLAAVRTVLHDARSGVVSG